MPNNPASTLDPLVDLQAPRRLKSLIRLGR